MKKLNIKFPSKRVCSKLLHAKSILAFSTALMVGAVGPSHAEDIEVFTNAFTGQSTPASLNSDLFPNVLFVLDNSTSMGLTEPIALIDPATGAEVTRGVNSFTGNGLVGSGNNIGSMDNPFFANTIDEACGGLNDVFNNRNEFIAGTGESRFNFHYARVPTAGSPGTVTLYQCTSRLNIMKQALSNVLSEESFGGDGGINIGLMRFNENVDGGDDGGTVVVPVSSINDETHLTLLRNEIATLQHGQATPLAEAYYEAYLYFNGQNIDTGFETLDTSGRDEGSRVTVAGIVVANDTVSAAANLLPANPNGLVPREEYVTGAGARSGSTYVSPIRTQCQDNSIVLLTDGEPTNDTDRDNEIEGLPGVPNCSGSCADELATFLNNNDISPAGSGTDVDGDGNGDGFGADAADVNTFTIGLNFQSPLLEAIGLAGFDAPAPDADGNVPTPSPTPNSFSATNIQELEAAFSSILNNLSEAESATFAAPVVSADAFSRTQSNNELYFALFRPSSETRWIGNVKRYELDPSTGEILDENGVPAFDENGAFRNVAQSFWSDAADGGDIAAGGAAENVGLVNNTPTPRNLFARIGGNITVLSDDTPQAAYQTFLTATNSLQIGQVAIPDEVTNRAEIAEFTLGVDVDDPLSATPVVSVAPNPYLGDNIHGSPIALTYSNGDDVVFYTSNQGMVHAIDADNGEELWAYVPDQGLLQNLGQYYNSVIGQKVYGLDAELVFDVERDPATGDVDEAIMYFGQRRGGRKLFALDVSQANNDSGPDSHIWTIDPDLQANFSRMGQTWSEPVVSQVYQCDPAAVNCEPTDVLIFSGGYDELYDDATVNVSSLGDAVQGNALFIVDAQTSDLIWVAGDEGGDNVTITEMEHSLVSQPSVVDVNQDGVVDTIFSVDVSGQVFRFDFTADDISDPDNSSGGIIASLSAAADDQLFFNRLNVAILEQVIGSAGTVIAPFRFGLTTGSGYRAHPLDLELDGNSFYVIYDENIFGPALDGNGDPTYEYSSSGGIFDPSDFDPLEFEVAPTVFSGDPIDTQLDDQLPVEAGFRIVLPVDGEKSITDALIRDGRLLATTYIPAEANAGNITDTCEAGLGNSIVYSIDLLSGDALIVPLEQEGIAPSPTVLDLVEEVEVTDANGNTTTVEVINSIVIAGGQTFDGDGVLDGNGNPIAGDGDGGRGYEGGDPIPDSDPPCDPADPTCNPPPCDPADPSCDCEGGLRLECRVLGRALRQTWWEDGRPR